jgi:cytochrome c oxidase subunit 2
MTMNQFLMFNDHTIIVVIIVTILIGYSVVIIISQTFFDKFMLEEKTLERIWTVFPSLSLLFVAVPSMKILYFTEEILIPSFSLKIIGHQWYWSYEIPGHFQEIDRFLKPSSVARLLVADPQVAVPTSRIIRLLVSSQDVIHSWALPSAGIKVDANPGRINQSQLTVKRPGLLFGQCSEICGANHSFMPITVKAIYKLVFSSLNIFVKNVNESLFIPQAKPLSWNTVALALLCTLILIKKSLAKKAEKKKNSPRIPLSKKWLW